MIRRQTLALAAALCALAIAGCSRSAKEPAAVETNVVDVAPSETPRVAPDAPVQSANAAAAVDSEPPPAPPAVAEAPDEQMLDDATASGMTTRRWRGEEPANDVDLPSPSEEK